MGTIAQDVEKYRKQLADRRSIGLNAYGFAEQLTYLLFLKMVHERTVAPMNQPSLVPAAYSWSELARRAGSDLESHYRETLEALSKETGLVGLMYRKARTAFNAPAVLKDLIENLVAPEGRNWTATPTAEKGAMFEDLLRKAAPNIGAKASQFYTPRALLAAIIDVMRPRPEEQLADPACGTGGTLLAAHRFISKHYDLDRDQKRALQLTALRGTESLEGAARLAMMNLLLHGIARFDGETPIVAAADPLTSAPAEHVNVVITNPPFGAESGVESTRVDFWVATANNQLNYLQHAVLMLDIGGRGAVFVPDNVLFLRGDGEKVRRRLLRDCRVHTLLRLPTGISFAPGVKANVLFFDRLAGAEERVGTEELWVYDLRTGNRFTPARSPITAAHLKDFVESFCSGHLDRREESDRFRRWTFDELDARPDFNLDVWAYISDGPIVDSRPANEILIEMLQKVAGAYDHLATIGDELGVEPSGPLASTPPAN
jgi:type I restriction enzyme M protein